MSAPLAIVARLLYETWAKSLGIDRVQPWDVLPATHQTAWEEVAREAVVVSKIAKLSPVPWS